MDNQKIKDWIFLTVGVVLIFLKVRMVAFGRCVATTRVRGIDPPKIEKGKRTWEFSGLSHE